MNSTPHILVVDDDRDIRELTSRFLRKHGLRVEVAASGKEMWQVLEVSGIDLIVLDRVMPGEDGLELCNELRQSKRIPVLLLTLLNSDLDRILGLEMGADDYLGKPFNPLELLARIRAVLRRANELPPRGQHSPAVFHFNGWLLDRSQRLLKTADGCTVDLTDGEFDLLLAFVERPGVVLAREQLLDIVRGRAPLVFDRSVDMQLVRLRKKIEPGSGTPQLIKTVRHKGYVFTPEVREE